MKKLLFFIILAFSGIVSAQQKVAIYVTGSEEVENSVKKIVSDELLAGIVKNKEFIAVERSADFLAEIQKEQAYQRSGQVNDLQISELGKQFGVDLVCVANITPFRDSYYINARLINVETATVQATARETSALNTLDEFLQTSESLASKLVGKKAAESAQETLTKEYSLILKGVPEAQPIELDNTGAYCKITFKFITPTAERIKIAPTSYIKDEETGIKYKLLGSDGIESDNWRNVPAGIHTFTLFVEKLPETAQNLTFQEDGGWSWKVKLAPYGKRNYYLFEDKSEETYKQLLAVHDQQLAAQKKQQETLQNNINNLGDAITNAINPEYILKVTNNRLHARVVYVDGQRIGVVGSLSVEFFRVSTKYYKSIELVQKDYLISPSRERFTNAYQPIKGQVV